MASLSKIQINRVILKSIDSTVLLIEKYLLILSHYFADISMLLYIKHKYRKDNLRNMKNTFCGHS